jgi:hypothetical protein
LTELKEVTSDLERAYAIDALEVLCQDDAQLFKWTVNDPIPTTEALKLGILLSAALQNLKNLNRISFRPYGVGLDFSIPGIRCVEHTDYVLLLAGW